MKKIIVLGSIAFIVACGQQSVKQESKPPAEGSTTNATELYFGDKITADGAQPITELRSMMGDKKELTTKLSGTIEAVCQKKGCWMDLKNGEESIRITFKDYGFFMPIDAAGKEAIIEGVAKVEETSVGDLKEYAKDAGKSETEIASIKEPKQELVFEANGVILR
jgi:hypothetical protein